MLTGIVSATTYIAADQNANGQYQIVYTVNPDNSQTFQAAGVAYGTMTVSDPPPTTGQSTSQDVQMSGQYGYALVAAQDSSGNQADSETWLYNGDADVHQFAGVIQPGADSSAQNQFGDIPVPFTGAYAGQCVYSRNASQIIADTDSEAVDGSAADVNAQATGLTPPVETAAFTGDGGGYGCSIFRVSQLAGAFSPVSEPTTAFSSVSHGFGDTAFAYQDGKIKGADSATVSTSATTVNGLSSMVSATVNGGGLPDSTGGYSTDGYYAPSSLSFNMYSSAKNQSEFTSGYGVPVGGSEYKVNSEADIEASGTSGSTATSANGPNGQTADVTANFVKDSYKNYGSPESKGNLDIDLSASAELNDHVTITKVENELSNLRGYEGNVNASNSAGDLDSSVFDRLQECRWRGGRCQQYRYWGSICQLGSHLAIRNLGAVKHENFNIIIRIPPAVSPPGDRRGYCRPCYPTGP